MAKLLDESGLSYFWNKFKSRLLPSGGSSGQVLAKASGTNYDVTWVNQSGGGEGGAYTPDEHPLANISSQGGDTQAQLYAFGGTATLTCGNDTTPSGQWGSKTLCTIPSGYRPPQTCYFPVNKTGNAQSDSYIMIDASTGTVTLQNWGGSQTSVSYFSTCTWAYHSSGLSNANGVSF